MKQLPKGWSHQKLGDLIELKYGTALPQKTRTNDGHPVFGSNGKIGEHNPALTSGETLIVGRKGSIGEVHYSPMACTPIDTTYYIDNVPDNTFKYWFHSLKSLNLNKLNKSTAIPGLSRNDVYNIDVPVPPTNEQRRIADKLDRVLARIDAANEHLSRVAPLIKRFRQSVLAAATSGRLTEDWRKNKLQEWKFERADAICAKVQSGGTPKAGFSPQGTPFLKVYNIVNQRIDFDYKPQFIAQEVHEGELKKSITLPDDVLMNIVGPPLGKVAIVSSTSPSWNINQAITLFRPSERILSKWIYIVLCEGTPIRSVLKSTKGSVGQVNISLSQCRAFSIPVPSIEEQSEIVRRVEKLFAFADHLEERLSQAQTAVQKLTPALLAKAFRGELVPQDPNDEPASELLKRLQESRTESTKPNRARKPRARKSP